MITFLRNRLSQQRLVGGALVLAVTQLGASLAGLIRDRTLAGTFPGLNVVDAYISSFRLSDLLFQMCIMAGFSVALVPLLAQYHGKNDTEALGRLLSGVVGMAAYVFGLVALVAAIFFPAIAPYLVQFEGESLALFITFGRLALLANFLMVFGNAFGQYLITTQRYWIYGITPILYTVGTIFGTLFLSTPETFGALGPMVGTLGGSALYVLLRFWAVLHSGCRMRPAIWHPELPEFFRLMLPRMVALGVLQLQLLLFDTVASGLPAGSVTINAYARNFQSVAVGVAGIALAQSAFSLLSQAAAKKEVFRFWIYLRKGMIVLLLVTVPCAFLLTFLAPVAAFLVHLTHRLDVFRVCLALYAVSIPFESMNHLLLRAFYSLRNTFKPAVFSVLNGAAAIALSWFLAPQIGVFALAIGFAAGQLIELLGLAILLPRQIELSMERGNPLSNLYKKIVH
ncbi:MAG: lipid II flippase MurJ [Candidatus Peribacteraceae bacterium]|nr:lipid II flippase MurJ [Candidatus Peribacteraceae bacterium]